MFRQKAALRRVLVIPGTVAAIAIITAGCGAVASTRANAPAPSPAQLARPAPVNALSYSCAVTDDASDTEYTGMTALRFTVTVRNPSTSATGNLPVVDVYLSLPGVTGEYGPYPFPVGRPMPPGESTLRFGMNAYADVSDCQAASTATTP